MGSTNPVFILPGAMHEMGIEIAKGLTLSVTLGVGQFCTNPGLVFWEESETAAQFQKAAAEQFQEVVSAPMLTPAIHQTFQNGIVRLTKQDGVQGLARGKAEGKGLQGTAVLLKTSAGSFLH